MSNQPFTFKIENLTLRAIPGPDSGVASVSLGQEARIRHWDVECDGQLLRDVAVWVPDEDQAATEKRIRWELQRKGYPLPLP